jgi:hypothetical protein
MSRNDGQVANAGGHLRRDLDPRFLGHVAGGRHHDRRARRRAMLDEEGVVVARLAAHA